jgi:hypothetical protein
MDCCNLNNINALLLPPPLLLLLLLLLLLIRVHLVLRALLASKTCLSLPASTAATSTAAAGRASATASGYLSLA